MALWGAADQANNAPKFTPDGSIPTSANLYNNTGSISVIGSNTAEAANTPGVATVGWQAVRKGQGNVSYVTINTGRHGLQQYRSA